MTKEEMESQEDSLKKWFQNLQGYLMGDASEPYSDKVMELAYDPLNVGEIENPDAQAEVTGACGDTIRMGITISKGRIINAKFLTNGCGATLACGSAVTDMIINKTPFEASKITPQAVFSYLNGLPSSHLHCAVLAVQALQEVLKNLRLEEKKDWKKSYQ